MRSPEGRAGRKVENELSLKYLSPGAFTVLTPEEYGQAPDPPSAPTQYRLTPNTRRRRSQAFAIIAESASNPGSRSPSPSGRVSPFRGRGFNPIGSRHASPNPSPPPDDSRMYASYSKNQNQSPKKSQIPQPSRNGSGTLFGDKVKSEYSPKFRRKNGSKLSPHLSKSLTNISPKNVSNKPPPSPNRPRKFSKKPAFEQLSPITGSSPESGSKESKSESSPSKIPRSSRSQPTSRKCSPTRTTSPSGKYSSRPGSKSNSRSTSRASSPSKGPTKIPVKSTYKDISAKVNSFSKVKPKVPPKPNDIKNIKSNDKPKLDRKESKLKMKKIDNINNKVDGNNSGKTSEKFNVEKKNDNKSAKSENDAGELKRNNNSNKNNFEQNQNNAEQHQTNSEENQNNSGGNSKATNDKDTELKTSESISKLTDISSATTVVSSTTSTATQPLKIDANFENILKEEFNVPKGTSMYMTDGRVLSATSVSTAINRMNDTVLNSQTLMKDHNFTKLSPAASAIISMSNDSHRGNKALDTKTATTALPTIESINRRIDGIGQNVNNSYMDSNKVFSVESIENTVRNNFNKTITPDHRLGLSGTVVQKSANERIREARTVIAADVKPIKILVREKPSDVEVQSGNVRFPVSATNGLNATPGLPPPEPPETEPARQEQDGQDDANAGCCARFFKRCKCKRSCKSCKKSSQEQAQKKGQASTGCFGCRKKKSKSEEVITSSTNLVQEAEKTKFLDRLKCCKSQKVGDTGCCPRGKRKESWADRRESTVTDGPKRSTGSRCKNFFRRIFCSTCCSCCKKKVVEDPISRRESMLSKKKSLTPTIPVEDPKPKIDSSLVEHTSHMKGAIPILPIPLAWFCLICNILLPGIGTILSGMFCLCLGKPRFSQNDGPRPRIGAFIINLIIGCGQLFTVLFCLVGWGWSIWWGVIMVKIARKHQRIRLVELRALDDRQIPVVNQNHHSRDPERGS